MLPPVNDDEDLILKEENPEIYAHLENVLVHMIDMQDVAMFKSQIFYVRNKKKFWNIYIMLDVTSLVGHILLCDLYM